MGSAQVFATDGLYTNTTINAINVGATVAINKVDAEILNETPSNGLFGSAYSSRTFVLGDNIYAEFEPKVIIDANDFRIGIQSEGDEAPNTLCGSTSNSFGIAPNGNLFINGGSVIATPLTYTVGTVLGLLVDYAGDGICRFVFYKDDVFVSISALQTVSLNQQKKYRLTMTIGASSDTTAEISCYLGAATQTYTPPESAIPLDDLVLPRDTEWVNPFGFINTIDNQTAVASSTFNLFTNGTFNKVRVSGFQGTRVDSGTWRPGGAVDVSNYEYSMDVTELSGTGTVTSIGGAVFDGSYNDLTTAIGVQVSINGVVGQVNDQSAEVRVEVREKANHDNRTGILLFLMEVINEGDQ